MKHNKLNTVLRMILITVFVLNAMGPLATVKAAAPKDEKGPTPDRTMPIQTPQYYHPKNTKESISFGPRPTPQPKIPAQAVAQPLSLEVSTQNSAVGLNQPVQLTVTIRNNTATAQKNLQFIDQLKNGFVYVTDKSSPVTYNSQKKQIEYSIPTLAVGKTFTFHYKVQLTNHKQNATKGELQLHRVLLNSTTGQAVAAQVPLLLVGNAHTEQASISPYKIKGGWHQLGNVSVYLDKNTTEADSVLMVSPIKSTGKGPALQYKLDIVKTEKLSRDADGIASEQNLALADISKKSFSKPGFIRFNLGSIIDLKNIPAGKEVYVATYDEANKIWVKIPILQKDVASNTVTVEAAHFSTWGAGLGSALPQNGANVMLFNDPFASLFSGSSQYSIPVWTPKGRNGMAPSISLSYSSGGYNGVLGDIQAPWVGGGWNIDGTEIVRKITTSDAGYGYENSFALTVNGTKYDLIQNSIHPELYTTTQSSFIYIKRHNFALENEDDNDGNTVDNTTGEWWEVVTTDGTHYRLGWNKDSEQLALMYGYSCTILNGNSPCNTPNGSYATLGYAGKTANLVAMRWRVDQVSDTHGNTMTYTYTEEHPDSTSKVPAFDRASYLDFISYTGTVDGDKPGYRVDFELGNRSDVGDDVPTAFNIWDNYDRKYLKQITISYLTYNTNGSINTQAIARTYDLSYHAVNVPNDNGTLVLDSIAICGGSYTGANCNVGFDGIAATKSPTISFTYQNLNNRAATGNTPKFMYPRLKTIDNGYGGSLTYTYGNDARGFNSWYNWRVSTAQVDSGVATSAIHGYKYFNPVYSDGDTKLAALVGYADVTDTTYDFDGTTKILDVTHHFGTEGPDVGYELITQSLDPNGTVLNKTTNTYVSDNSAAPFPEWNYRYLYETASYILSGGTLTLTTKTRNHKDPATGNLIYREDFKGNTLYRKLYYEYVSNLNPRYHIVNKTSRALIVDSTNQIFSDTYYHYDGATTSNPNLAPTVGELTMVQNLVSGTQTTDVKYKYDAYGNQIAVCTYRQYGTVNTIPTSCDDELTQIDSGDYSSSAYALTTTEYDNILHTYSVAGTNPAGYRTTSNYLYTLGVPNQATDPNGWVSTTTYDGLGRVLSSNLPGVNGAATQFVYPDASSGSVSAPYNIQMYIQDPTKPGADATDRSRSIWGIYDGLGRILQTQVLNDDTTKLLISNTDFNAQGAGYKQSTPYYASGPGGTYKTPDWSWSTITNYDALGRSVKTTAPGNIVTTTEYDGLTTTSYDANDHATIRTTDALGRLSQVKETNEDESIYSTTTYYYDMADRLIKVLDAQNNSTILQYDFLGRKTDMNDPDMGVWSYDYDAFGNLIRQIDARSQAIDFYYDSLNRMIGKNYNDEATPHPSSPSSYAVSNTYSTTPGSLGMRTHMYDDSGDTGWEYSNYGRTVTETKTIGKTTPSNHGSPLTKSSTSTSDWLGRPLTLTYPDNDTVTYHYDALGQPQSIDRSTQYGVNLVELAYNQLGQITTTLLGNGATITNNYDSAGGTYRLVNRRADMSVTNLMNYWYQYDDAGNILQVTDSKLGETINYQYDSLDRLKNARDTKSNGSVLIYDQSYSYDKIGNLLQVKNNNNSLAMSERAPMAGSPANSNILTSDNSPDLNHGQDSLVSYKLPSGLNYAGNTSTPTQTLTSTKTFTPTQTYTNSKTPTITATKPARTATQTPTITVTWTPSKTKTPTVTNTKTATPVGGIPTSTPTPSNTPNPTNTTAPILAGYWKFEETGTPPSSPIYDDASTGNTNHGTLYAGTRIDDGAKNKAIRFSNNTFSIDSIRIGSESGGTFTAAKVWSFANNTEGWAGNPSVDDLEWQSGGYLNGIIIGADPYIVSDTDLGVNISTNKIIKIRVKNTSLDANARFYFATGTDTIFTSDKWLGFSVAAQSDYTEYTVDMSGETEWTGNLNLLRFDMPSDSSPTYIQIPDAASLKPTNGITVSAWVYPEDRTYGTTYTILNKGGTDFDYTLRVNNKGYLEFRMADLNIAPINLTPTPAATQANTTGPQLPLNVWSMVTGVYDPAAKLIKLYVNGQLVSSEIVTGGTVSYDTSPLYIGYPSSDSWVGSIDEVRVYSGAKTNNEVIDLFGSFATPTPQPTIFTDPILVPPATKTPTSVPPGITLGGDGSDYVLTVTPGAPFNLNTSTNGYGGRTCADGVAYKVSSLGSTVAVVSVNPTGTCLVEDDEVMLVSLQGGAAHGVGNYEFLRVSSVTSNRVSFKTQKTKFYGTSAHSDAGIGLGTNDQKVMLIRVPNYTNVTVTGTLTANAWDGTAYGLIVFRANDTLTGAGNITMDGLGYRSQVDSVGETYRGYELGYGGGASGGANDNAMPKGGGGGYGTNGATGANPDHDGDGGLAYGSAKLNTLYMGSGGGSAGRKTGANPAQGPAGTAGGGIIFIDAATINMSGTISSKGANSGSDGGSGAGGSIRIQANAITAINLNANGGTGTAAGGVGRIAVYYKTSQSITTDNPNSFIGQLGQPATATATATAITFPTGKNWGTGADGDLTVNSSTTLNLNTGITGCSQGTAASFGVIELGASYALLSANVSGCLKAGDEIMLTNLTGTSAQHAYAGNYEFLRVGAISGNRIDFVTQKINTYGIENNITSNLGTATPTPTPTPTTPQRVMIVRVPNYHNVTVNATGILTASSWDGTAHGALVFRVSGTLSVAGTISMAGAGYRGNTDGPGENYAGFANGYGGGASGSTSSSYMPKGGGGAYGTNGSTGPGGNDGSGGTAYGEPELDDHIYFGGGGGSAGELTGGGNPGHGGPGGAGGGIVYIAANTISLTGSGAVSVAGSTSDPDGGSGAGGSVRMEGNTISLGASASINIAGGASTVSGGQGRLAVYYWTSYTNSSGTTPGYLRNLSVAFTPTVTKTPTHTLTPSITPTATATTVDGYTKSFLAFDGADTSTTFTDSTGKSWSATGAGNNAQLDTSIKKVGSASLQLDGTSDDITTSDSDDFYFSTGDFTIDTWVRFSTSGLPSSGTNAVIYSQWVDANNNIRLYLANSSGTYYWVFRVYSGGTMTINVQRATTLSVGVWYHLAIVRTDQDFMLFENGTQLGSPTDGSGVGIFNLSAAVHIGTQDGSTSPLNGRLDNFRVSKGIARWTEDFVPDEIDSYTKVLLPFDGTDAATTFTDTADKTWTATGNAQLDTSSRKAGTASLLLDGTGDDITTSDSNDFYFSTGDFTIDTWVRLTSLPSSGANAMLYAQWVDANNNVRLYLANSSGTYYWVFRVYDGGTMSINVQKATTISTAVWHHIAVVRNGSNFMIFEDGTQLGSTVSDADAVPSLAASVRVGTQDGSTSPLAARLDQFRVSKGIARWTSNFAAPTPVPSNKQLDYTYSGTKPHAVATIVDNQNPGTDVRNYQYDDNGNMTYRKLNVANNDDDMETWITYNEDNRVATVMNKPGPNFNTVSYTLISLYDGDGTRVAQLIGTGSGLTMSAFFMGGAYEATVNPSGTETGTRKYYSFGGVSMVDDGSGMTYFLTDQQGSMVVSLNASGQILSQQRYMPFGQVRKDTGISTSITQTDFGYTGQRNLDALGLMDYNARFYDPTIGRFIQPDTIVSNPVNPQTWNRYGYVENNPINRIDPTGHASDCSNYYAQQYDPACKPKPVDDPVDDETQTDVTEWLANELKDQQAKLKAKDDAILAKLCFLGICDNAAYASYLYSSHLRMFGNAGIYNIKLGMANINAGSVALCGSEGCKWVDYSAPGNIMYGYLSASRGIDQKISWMAAGELEKLDARNNGTPYTGTDEAWGDDPGDKAAVDFGYSLFATNPKGLSFKDFQAALTMNVLNSFQAPLNVPSSSPMSQVNTYPSGYFLHQK